MYYAPLLINLAVALCLWVPLQLEELHGTVANLGIDCLDHRTGTAKCQENGVENSQHALVCILCVVTLRPSLIPYHVGSCSRLSPPKYGRVSVTTRDVGGRATYTCSNGFRMVGSSTRTCLSDGSWSGSEPVCECEFHQLGSKLINNLLQ